MKHPKKVSKHIIDWINTYLENSKINGLVVGVSGGVDSALTSTLCAETGKKLICIEKDKMFVDCGGATLRELRFPCRVRNGNLVPLGECDWSAQLCFGEPT